MQKRINIMTIISLFLSISALTGCSNVGQMPKVKGKEVNFTNKELERKLERLNFTLQEDKIIESTGKISAKEIINDLNMEATLNVKTTRNLANYDLWVDGTVEYKIDKGIDKATISGFESNRYTYFDIGQNSNNQFDFDYDRLNFNIYNGKYRIEKVGFGGNDIEEVFNSYNVPFIDPNFEAILDLTSLDMILDLNYYNYSKLKFYEDNNYFSISLKTDYKILKSERIEIYDTFDDYISFPDDEDIIDFKYEIVLVFERNKISAAGINVLVEAKEEERGEHHYYKHEDNYSSKYVEKLPKEIIYNDYSPITDLEEIIK